MKTEKVKFADIPAGTWFYDWSHSGDWLQKVDDSCAYWEDGLMTTFQPDDVVEVVR